MPDTPTESGEKPLSAGGDGSSPSDGVGSEEEQATATHFLRAVQESIALREKFLQLEFKAKKAYECSLNISKPVKGLDEKLKEEIGKALNEAHMEELKRQLNLDPPRIEMVPYLLQLGHHSLVDALPARHQARVMEEFRASMGSQKPNPNDPDVSSARISYHIRTIVEKIIEFGAPSRTEALQQDLHARCSAVDSCTPSLGEAVADAFRFVFQAIKQLHEDIAQYTLLMVSEDLRTNAVTYIRSFLTTCLPPPSAWKSTIEFLKKHIHTRVVEEWVASPNTENTTGLTPAQHRLRGAVLFGALALLRSGRRNGTNRWADLPAEAFYFDKVLIFEAANAVQESTLLLLLEGAVSSIFKGKGGSTADTTRMLHSLHAKILNLFATDLRLDDLKREVVTFIHKLLAEGENTGKTLTPEEEAMVSSVIKKMAETEGQLYISFEQKVLNFVSRKIKKDDNIPPLGLVTPSLTQTTALLAKGLSFNWEVYAPFYMEILPLLSQD